MSPSTLHVGVGDRVVPAVLWRPALDAGSLVLLGHGGSGHKTAPRQQMIACRLVDAGMSVVAIDGPAHGDRTGHIGTNDDPQRQMVADWLAAVDAVRATGAGDGPLGYLGLSMGTRFGLPLAATLGEQLACAVLGKFGPWAREGSGLDSVDADRLFRDAERITAATLWHVQRDDELFPRDGQLELFDRLATQDKQLVAFPGGHATTADTAIDEWIDFLVGHLTPGGR